MHRWCSDGDISEPGDHVLELESAIEPIAGLREITRQVSGADGVVNRPKDLTGEQLKEVRRLLDQNGYSEANLRTAWRNRTNHEIAASIIGYIRPPPWVRR